MGSAHDLQTAAAPIPDHHSVDLLNANRWNRQLLRNPQSQVSWDMPIRLQTLQLLPARSLLLKFSPPLPGLTLPVAEAGCTD